MDFFDAILQQKEGYSDYRWEDVVAKVLKNDPALQKRLQDKKLEDVQFATNASGTIRFYL